MEQTCAFISLQTCVSVADNPIQKIEDCCSDRYIFVQCFPSRVSAGSNIQDSASDLPDVYPGAGSAD